MKIDAHFPPTDNNTISYQQPTVASLIPRWFNGKCWIKKRKNPLKPARSFVFCLRVSFSEVFVTIDAPFLGSLLCMPFHRCSAISTGQNKTSTIFYWQSKSLTQRHWIYMTLQQIQCTAQMNDEHDEVTSRKQYEYCRTVSTLIHIDSLCILHVVQPLNGLFKSIFTGN